jgi:hypothetical protein
MPKFKGLFKDKLGKQGGGLSSKNTPTPKKDQRNTQQVQKGTGLRPTGKGHGASGGAAGEAYEEEAKGPVYIEVRESEGGELFSPDSDS